MARLWYYITVTDGNASRGYRKETGLSFADPLRTIVYLPMTKEADGNLFPTRVKGYERDPGGDFYVMLEPITADTVEQYGGIQECALARMYDRWERTPIRE